MKQRSKMQVLGVLVVAALALVAWDRNEMSIYQLRVNTVRGANDTDTITIVNPVKFSSATQPTTIELGHASDTTLSRASAGVMAVEGKNVYVAAGTDVAVADGGTGASTLTDGGVLLGSGTDPITATAVLTDGQMIVGDGTGDPAIESGATLRTSVGVGTGDSPQFAGLTLTGPIQQTATDASGYSYNLLAVTAAADANIRGWRVNVSSGNAQTNTDMQCVHGYLTAGTTPTYAANAAVYPLSAWLDLPDSSTFAGASVVAGVRSIIDANNNAIGSAAASVESALFYGQTWAGSGTIDDGIFIAAGAGTTIDSVLELGGTGTFGTIFDLTSVQTSGFISNHLTIVKGGPSDDAGRHFSISAGPATSRAEVVAAVGAASAGSVYFSTAGKMYICTAGASTWQKVTTSGAD